MPKGTGDLQLRTPVQRSQPPHFRIVARLKSGEPLYPACWIPPAAQSGHCPSRRLRLPQGAMQSVQSGPPETWEERDRVPLRSLQATLLPSLSLMLTEY